MQSQAFIFIGRSGCGKGTQVKLLLEALKRADPRREFYHLETGERFREFIERPDYSAGLAKTIMSTGKRQPDFLAVWIWSHLLIEKLKGGETLVLDGTPRSVLEAEALDTALNFYGYTGDRYVVHLNISPAVAIDRLSKRGRADDQTLASIKKRLAWFETDVLPAIEYYRQNQTYQLLELDGELTVEQIHKNLSARLGLSPVS